MICPTGCDVIPAAVGRCDWGTPSCVADHRPVKPCPVQTEMLEHRFVCQLRAGHDSDHAWWLAAPTYGPVPVWTAGNLIEDDWENP